MGDITAVERPWYAGITRYQWFVLLIACLGWIFDVFQGQIFALLKTPMMIELLGVAKTDPNVSRYSDVALLRSSWEAGGGAALGILADRIGRRQAMVWSILTYSVFTGLHYFATNVAQIVALRFFVAVGVAGEWAVAASLVAEVFPEKAAPWPGHLPRLRHRRRRGGRRRVDDPGRPANGGWCFCSACCRRWPTSGFWPA